MGPKTASLKTYQQDQAIRIDCYNRKWPSKDRFDQEISCKVPEATNSVKWLKTSRSHLVKLWSVAFTAFAEGNHIQWSPNWLLSRFLVIFYCKQSRLCNFSTVVQITSFTSNHRIKSMSFNQALKCTRAHNAIRYKFLRNYYLNLADSYQFILSICF